MAGLTAGRTMGAVSVDDELDYQDRRKREFLADLRRMPDLGDQLKVLAMEATDNFLNKKERRQEKDRIHRLQRAGICIIRLRRRCDCGECDNGARKDGYWPFYYVPRERSFECWLEENCPPDKEERESRKRMRPTTATRWVKFTHFDEDGAVMALAWEAPPVVDEDMAEALAPLRNERERIGAAFVAQKVDSTGTIDKRRYDRQAWRNDSGL